MDDGQATLHKTKSKMVARRGSAPANGVKQKRAKLSRELPIANAREEILDVIESRSATTVLIVGDTGSGKSTQVVKYLLERGVCSAERGRRCVITEPRRVAVTSVCGRVAEELGCQVGESVGYAMRFEQRLSKKTAIKFTTDGYLIRECCASKRRLAEEYRVVIIDEAHERSLATDVMCGLAKKAALQHPNRLTVVAMSATLDFEALSAYFAPPIRTIHVDGRLHAIDLFYCVSPQEDYVDAAARATAQLHRDPTCKGDVLVFMPGQEEISAFCAAARRELGACASRDAVLLPLFAALPAEQQALVFAECDSRRKIVVATTIAETSLTIPGVHHVIDPGIVKTRRFSATTGFEALELVPTSKAQAKQRAGRAGREAPGRCYRLYTEKHFATLPDETPPEILRSDLATIVLQLKHLGIEKPQDFDFVSKPPRAALLRALETLQAIEALAPDGSLSPKGKRLAALPLSPLLANLALVSTSFAPEAASKAVDAVALLATSDSIFAPHADKRAFVDRNSDLLTEVNAFRAARKLPPSFAEANSISYPSVLHAAKAADQICAHLGEQVRVSNENDEARIHEQTIDCLVAGLCVLNAAQRHIRARCYRTFRGGHDVYVHPASVLHARNPPPQSLVFASCVHTNKRYVRGLTAFHPSRLPELAPHVFEKHNPTQR